MWKINHLILQTKKIHACMMDGLSEIQITAYNEDYAMMHLLTSFSSLFIYSSSRFKRGIW